MARNAEQLGAGVVRLAEAGEPGRAAAQDLDLRLQLAVLRFDEAIDWLSRAAFGEGAGASPRVPAHGAAADVVELLRDVYNVARDAIQRSRDAGESIPAPECLHAAYQYLEGV
jgi:hypothetical protein